MSYSYIRRVPSVSTYNGVGASPGGLGNPYAVAGGIIAALENMFPTDEDAEIAALEDPTTPGFKDNLAPPKATKVPASPPKTIATPGPATPGPASPPAASSGGLSTMTLVGGGVAALAVVGGLVYWKKTKGSRR